MQAFSNQQPPNIQALFSQFLAQLPAAQIEQLTRKPSDGSINIRTESRTHLPTKDAGPVINRKDQTMRGWHSAGRYPIPELRPITVNGRLLWPVAGLRKVLGVAG